MRKKFFLLVLLLLGLSPLRAQTQPSSLDQMIRSRGLERLTDQEIAVVKELLASAMQASTSRTTLATSAEAYLRDQGYKVCRVSVEHIRGDSYLIVSHGFRTDATKDVPFGLGLMTLKSGDYFCKPSFVEGITELIDGDGDVQRFFFSDWIELK